MFLLKKLLLWLLSVIDKTSDSDLYQVGFTFPIDTLKERDGIGIVLTKDATVFWDNQDYDNYQAWGK